MFLVYPLLVSYARNSSGRFRKEIVHPFYFVTLYDCLRIRPLPA